MSTARRSPVESFADAKDDVRFITQEDSLWYKDAVIYQLHVRSFCDAMLTAQEISLD
jgi:hypothetical protein